MRATRAQIFVMASTSVDELAQYSEDVLANKIKGCQKHKWACLRFLNDLERQGTEGFPWVFDEDKANKFLRWMSFFKHTKGELEGKIKIPEPIEKFIFGNIYGWVHKDTGMRRFRKGYWQVARKNAKSQDLAIMGLYEMSAFGEPYSEVYVAATKKDQTRYVWGEARLIAEACVWLNDKIMAKYHQDLNTKVLMHPKSNSFFARMSQDDKKKGDGANPQCGLLDEYHLHDTTEYYDVLTSGMKSRKQPILMIITTAGFELNNPCYREEYKYISDILNPDIPIDNDRYFAMINELDMDDEGVLIDDINDESCWVKSNPIVTKSEVGLEAIRDELKMALDKPEKMRDFLTKTMNVWVNMRNSGFMNMAKWKLCGVNDDKKFYNLIKGLEVTVGFDLSSTIDLSSLGFEIPLPDGRIVVASHSFMPEATLFSKMRTDKVPYDLWRRQGWLSVTPGNEIDYRFMVKYALKFIKKYGLLEGEFCFDRYMAAMLMSDLSNDGHAVIDIPQGIPTLGIPTKDFRAKAYNGKVIHNNNPVLTWAISNAVTRKDHNDNIMLDKGKSTERIDPIASIINAHVRVMTNEVPDCPYDEGRGIIVL